MSTVQIGNLVLSQRRKDEVEQRKRLSCLQYIAQDKRAYFISYFTDSHFPHKYSFLRCEDVCSLKGEERGV